MATYPKLSNYDDLLQLLQTGLGETGNITAIGMGTEVYIDVSSGKAFIKGQPAVAASLVSDILLERFSGLIATWGRLDDKQIKKLAALQHFYRPVRIGFGYEAGRYGATLFQAMLQKLFDGTQGTHVFVGHDDNMSAFTGMLGLTYNDPSFGVDSTTTLSRMQFNLWDTYGKETVTATYYSVDFDGKDTAPEGTPVHFVKLGIATETTADQLQMLFDDGKDWACLLNITKK